MCDAAYYRYGNKVLLIVNFIEASATCSAHLARPSTNHELKTKKTRVIEELEVQCILMDLVGLSTSTGVLFCRFYSSLEHSLKRCCYDFKFLSQLNGQKSQQRLCSISTYLDLRNRWAVIMRR